MKLVIENLLRYFDDPLPGEKGKGDATALVALLGEDLASALFVQYLRDTWGPAEFLTNRCTTGNRKGPRLDGWIRITRHGESRLLQVEIKSWSAHAIGGRNLPLSASPEQLRAHKLQRWGAEWNGHTFKKKQARKVLEPMQPPMALPVEPAICYWDALHPSGLDDSFFEIPLENEAFGRVWVFSVSAYLRATRAHELDLDMPNAERRIELLRWISPSQLKAADA